MITINKKKTKQISKLILRICLFLIWLTIAVLITGWILTQNIHIFIN